MKHLLIAILLCGMFSQLNAQDENRKGHLFFKVGTEYRITPLPWEFSEQPTVFSNIDLQNSGPAFNYSLDYFITKNLSIGFTHSIRYSLLLYNNDTSVNFISRAAEKTWMHDYHFYLDYHFKIFKNKESDLFVRLGQSLMNTGSDFSTTKAFFDQNGEIIGHLISQGSFRYSASNFAIGYKKKRLEAMIGVYSSKNVWLIDPNTFTVPYIKLSYSLKKF